MKIIKGLFLATIVLIAATLLSIIACNRYIRYATQDFVTYDIRQLPNEKVGMVLGTAKFTQNGYKNYYFFHRIDAAEKLYKSGKIQYLIVSGDNSVKGYNEPEDMKNELISRGIPAHKIYEDFAGFRTLDSVVRAKEIFGQKSFIIISQKFHNERAIFLAQKNGILAYGYNAKDVNQKAGFKTNVREKFARVKVFIDLLIGKEPKFSGEKIIIGK